MSVSKLNTFNKSNEVLAAKEEVIFESEFAAAEEYVKSQKSKETNYDITPWRKQIEHEFDNLMCAADLIVLYHPSQITYGQLLNCFEWKFKRLKILFRDSFKCADCGVVSKSNHVHHNYYLYGQLPWDIDDSALSTLCAKCHKSRHLIQEITVFRNVNNSFVEISRERPFCTRCGGIGYFIEFLHVKDGVCFKCNGDTIHKSVFSEAMSTLYQNLSLYDEKYLRNNYRQYLNSMNINYFYNRHPDANYYFKKNETDSFFNDEFDNLPF